MENRDGSIYTPTTASEQVEAKELADVGAVVYTGAASIEEVAPAIRSDLAAVLLRRCRLGAPQLALLPALRHVVRMGAGVDNIDLAACAEAGVVVSNVPDAWTEEVADSAMALMLGTLRRTHALDQHVRRGGGWTRQAELPRRGIRRLRGLRLGLVGLGRIGTAVAQRARPFGFELAFYDPYLPAGVEKGLGGVTRADSFGSLLASVDVLSFHCPLTPCTRHMLDAAGLHARARAGCAPLVVINTARGGVVDEAALLDGLSDGSVLGAALDSLQEEPDVSTALLAAQASGATLLITPHAAFYSDEAFGEMRLLAAREVRRVLRAEAPHYRMN